MKNRVLSVLMLGASLSEAGAQSAIPHGKVVRHLMVDGVQREVVLHVPDSVDGSSDVPVVFMLHGTSGSGHKFYNISGWVEKLHISRTAGTGVWMPSCSVNQSFSLASDRPAGFR